MYQSMREVDTLTIVMQGQKIPFWQMLEQIRQTLLEQQLQATDDRMTLKIAFKLPDGSKCEGQFAEDSSAKVC